jgi:U6 snRNA-associated Sm-like protein LSm1
LSNLSPGKYCDVPLGLYVVRGDSIVLLGELDSEKEENSTKLEKIQPQDFIALSADIPDSNNKVEWDFESW